jgi:large subunit ribosomal protein L6
MSRVAKNPITLPSGVTVTMQGQDVTLKGSKGTLKYQVHDSVAVVHEDNQLRIAARNESDTADQIAGTMRALLNNMVAGVAHGFECKLELVGVGYRAQVQGKHLNLTLGFSHPVVFTIPAGITIETPSQTEVVVKGLDKHLLKQVAAKIRAYRPPEPYKGKGVRYAGEKIELKETKKK